MENSKSILLVEDDASDQYFFREAIRDMEHVTLYGIAENGQEALDKLRSAEVLPDLIFTDIHMPVMDAVLWLSEKTKDPAIKDIPVVVLSSDTSQAAAVRREGARAFIKKPQSIATLRSRLTFIINIDFITEDNIAADTFRTALASC